MTDILKLASEVWQTSHWTSEQLKRLERFAELVAAPLRADAKRAESAIKTLEQLGYANEGGELWKPPLGKTPDFNLIDSLMADAERYRWLSNLPCNSLTLSRNDDHACNYMTAEQWIEEHPEEFKHTPTAELQLMKDSNTIWSLQVFPFTPIGSVTWNAASMGAVLDLMRTKPNHD